MTEGFLYSMDPVRFVREKLGFYPDAFQKSLLSGEYHRALVLCCRQFGKSTTTAALAVCRAYSKPHSLILVLSPTMRQSGEFLAKAAAYLRRLEISRRADGTNPMSLLLPNGSRIVGLSDVEATVRGYSGASLIIIDEAARISDPLY